MLCTLKHHQRSGSHAVSLALWQSGGRVTSVIKTLPPHVLQGILALFRTVYRIVHRAGPLSHVEAMEKKEDSLITRPWEMRNGWEIKRSTSLAEKGER